MQPRRILLVRLDGIGDALACTPLIDALRRAGHTLGIALSDRNSTVFSSDATIATHVLERIPWPKHGSTLASRTRADADIAALRYDVALIASEEPEAYELARGIPQRVGFTTGWAKPFKSVWVRTRLTRAVRRTAAASRHAEHEVDVLFRLAEGLTGAAEPERDPGLLRPYLNVADVKPERSGVLVQLGAKWATVGVGADVLQRVVTSLRSRGARFIAAPAEARAIAAALPLVTFDVPPTTRAWMHAIDAAAALVSPDTGAAHVAGMLGVPVVDVFGDARFDVQAHRWRPWASSSVVLRASEIVRAPETIVVQALDAV